jgi:hypothetical protein
LPYPSAILSAIAYFCSFVSAMIFPLGRVMDKSECAR